MRIVKEKFNSYLDGRLFYVREMELEEHANNNSKCNKNNINKLVAITNSAKLIKRKRYLWLKKNLKYTQINEYIQNS